MEEGALGLLIYLATSGYVVTIEVGEPWWVSGYFYHLTATQGPHVLECGNTSLGGCLESLMRQHEALLVEGGVAPPPVMGSP